VLGYEAAFGPLQAAAAAAAPSTGRDEQEGQQDRAASSLAEMWDAPSHALPPPNVLAEASLEAMLAGLVH
jgi:hypothetical protein